jgi:pyruvate,water dikinase
MRVIPLQNATSLASVGGKAANLARLIAAGAPVPDGFVLTSSAVQHFVAEQEQVTREVEQEVLRKWAALEANCVIVRSSAVGEDSEEASFAGQLDSVPHVSTEDQLRAAILEVWESQWSDRAVAYQAARNTFLAGMGVIVQRQVDAHVSGVLFTVSPTSPGHMLLEYCDGLGEALVSGAVNPGRMSIARETLACEQLATCDGVTMDDTHAKALALLALDLEHRFGAPQDIEWTIDRERRLWIVQSRPITTATHHRPNGPNGPYGPRGPRGPNGPNGPNGPSGPKEPKLVFWSNANVNENFPQPISPLLYSIARVGYYHYFRNLGRAFGVSRRRLAKMESSLRQIIGVHGARMYYNLTSIHHVLRSAPFGDLLAASFDQFVGAETDDHEETSHGRAYEVLELGVIAARTTWQYLFLTSRVVEFERTADRFAGRTHPIQLRNKDAAELLEDLRAFIDIRCNRWKNASLADAGSMVCYGGLQRVLARAFPEEDQQALHNTLLKALPGLVSGVPALKLWELSRLIRASEPLRQLVARSTPQEALTQIEEDEQYREFRNAMNQFLENWGFRCSAELMLTSPSFQEDPAPVIDLLRSYAAMDGDSPQEQLDRQAADRVRETKRVLSALRVRRVSRWVPFLSQAHLVGVVLRWTQRCIQLRERARLKQALLYSRLRRIALALGDRLVQSQRLAQRDDVFYLTYEELDLLVAGGEMFPDHVKGLVDLRRSAHKELSASTPPDSMHLRRGEYLTSTRASERVAAHKDDAALRGVGACGGSTTAAAAILLDVTESERLRAGDILVTRQTDPGWGPIFPLISGLVIERGGMLSHGAIIAREFGIPSVVGVKDATRLIQHGSSITVDGDRGIVHVGSAR